MSGMSLIIKTVTRIFWPILLLLAFYISVFGHITPGGGFPGGVILAGACILPMISHGLTKNSKIEYQIKRDYVSKLSLSGKALKALFAVLILFEIRLIQGIPGELFSAGSIPIINLSIGLMIGFGFISAFYAFIFSNEKPEGDIH